MDTHTCSLFHTHTLRCGNKFGDGDIGESGALGALGPAQPHLCSPGPLLHCQSLEVSPPISACKSLYAHRLPFSIQTNSVSEHSLFSPQDSVTMSRRQCHAPARQPNATPQRGSPHPRGTWCGRPAASRTQQGTSHTRSLRFRK